MLREISERAEWIKDMEKLGEGKQYRTMIRNEIAERLNRIKILEKKRMEAQRETDM